MNSLHDRIRKINTDYNQQCATTDAIFDKYQAMYDAEICPAKKEQIVLAGLAAFDAHRKSILGY